MKKLLIKLEDFLLTFLGLVYYNFRTKYFLDYSESFYSKYKYHKIRKLLIKCNDVKYYNDLFNKLNFDPCTDFNSLADLNKIPILNNKIVRENINSFYNLKFNNYLSFKTSGTSGKPIETRVSKNHWIIEQSIIWRQWFSAGYKLFDHISIIRSYNPSNDQPLYYHDKLKNWTYYSPFHMTEENLYLYHKTMQKNKTKFLRGYPSSIVLFAKFCKKNKLKLDNLKACLTASETLSPENRKFIETYFKVKVFDHYGLAEGVIMIHNLDKSGVYKVCKEYGYLELIPTKIKNEFSIVSTCYNNYAMPLIRYNTNDIAIAKKDKAGGLELVGIKGRRDKNIKSKSGEIPTINFYTIFSKILGIDRWQIVQYEPGKIIINLKVLNGYDYESVCEQIINQNSTDIKFTFNQNNFVLTGEGKFNVFIIKC